MVKIQSENYTCIFDGKLTKIPVKRNRKTTISTNGRLDETYVRPMVEYNVDLFHIDKENYENLIKILLYENKFSVFDSNRNIDDAYFMFDVNELSLTEIQDKDNYKFYYTGSQRIRRV